MNISDEPPGILLSFFSAMNKWEKDNYMPMREGGIEEQSKAQDEIDTIFLKFCSIRDRKIGRQASLQCGEPPEYSIDTQPIVHVETKGKKVVVYTEQLNRLKINIAIHFIIKMMNGALIKKNDLAQLKISGSKIACRCK